MPVRNVAKENYYINFGENVSLKILTTSFTMVLLLVFIINQLALSTEILLKQISIIDLYKSFKYKTYLSEDDTTFFTVLLDRLLCFTN